MTPTERIVEAYRRSAWIAPDSVVIDEPDWHLVVTPSTNDAAMNTVRHSVLSDDAADEIIEQTLNVARLYGSDFRWAVTDLSRPLDLARRLEKHGMTGPARGWGMLRPAHLPLTAADPSIEVRRVFAEDVDLFVEASMAGWSNPPGFAVSLKESTLAAMAREPDSLHFYVAIRNAQPAGSGRLQLLTGSGYLAGGAVAPTHRKNGVYQALLSHRLGVAAGLGLEYASVLAMVETSAPICVRNGFERVCDVDHWSLLPSRNNRPNSLARPAGGRHP